MRYNHFSMLPENAFKPRNGRSSMTLEGGGSGGGGPQSVTQTSIPEYAQPSMERLIGKAEALTEAPYQIYGGERFAGATPQQSQARYEASQLQTPGQFGVGTGLVGSAGIQSLRAGQYQPSQFFAQQVGQSPLAQYQMGPAMNVSSQQISTPFMQTAQTGFRPELERFQMTSPEQFGSEQAQRYMDPYMQQVVDIQKRKAVDEAKQMQLAANLSAARSGTYGGARQTLAQTQRERALGQQLSDIQASGSQAAFQQAQQQFDRDRAAQMAAQQENLRAAMGVQELGTRTGLEASLANLSAAQQANVQNQATQLQAMGMNQEQALRAALANQQAGLTVGQQNLQALLETQRLGSQTSLEAQRANQQAMLEAQRLAEQSRQFGGELGLRGAGQAIEAGKGLAQIGQTQQASEIERLKNQEMFGSLTQGEKQRLYDLQYQDFMAQQQFPYTQLSYMGDILRGIPGRSVYEYQQPASGLQQIVGPGLLGLGMYREFLK
jgi:hypothetical protein